MNMVMTDDGENDEICDNDCSLSQMCHQHQPCHMLPNTFTESKGCAVDSLFFRMCVGVFVVCRGGRKVGRSWMI